MTKKTMTTDQALSVISEVITFCFEIRGNSNNDKGVEYWIIWTPDMLDMVIEFFKTVKDAKSWIDNQEAA